MIRILLEDARTPFTEIARRIGVSEAAIRKRVKELLKKDIIRKFTVEVDWKKLGYNYHVIVGLDTKPESLLKVLDDLKKEEKIIRIMTCSGDHMIIFEAIFKDRKEFEDFIRGLEGREDVKRVCPAIVVEEFFK